MDGSVPMGKGANSAEGVDVPRPSIERVYVDNVLLLRWIAIRNFRIPEEDAKALVHDVFLSYIAKPAAVHTNIRAYLIAAIGSASKNYWRSKRTEHRVFTEEDVAALEDSPKVVVAGNFVDDLALNQTIGATLARLPRREREALKRRYLNGEDTKTIAAALNTTPGNVDYIMHVGRKRALAEYRDITRFDKCDPNI